MTDFIYDPCGVIEVEAVPTAPLVWAATKSSLLNGGVSPV